MAIEADSPRDDFVIITPVFNDWQSLNLLLRELDKVLHVRNLSTHVLIVDDASSVTFDSFPLDAQPFAAIKSISILELMRNFGHQRAIALGLAYVEANMDCRAAIVMDADGEDDPQDVPRLIEKCEEMGYGQIIFARRVKRNESRTFKLFYLLYKWLYKLLTGHSIGVGNFSIVPRRILHRLVCVSELWNHYAVAVMKAKIPATEIKANRGKRLAGQSRMNFVSLVIHGLSAISIYGDVIGVRLLISTLVLMVLALTGIGVAIIIRLMTTLAIPGWATYLTASLLVIALQALSLSLFFIFTILSSRNSAGFLPARDYSPFVLRLQTIYPGYSGK